MRIALRINSNYFQPSSARNAMERWTARNGLPEMAAGRLLNTDLLFIIRVAV